MRGEKGGCGWRQETMHHASAFTIYVHARQLGKPLKLFSVSVFVIAKSLCDRMYFHSVIPLSPLSVLLTLCPHRHVNIAGKTHCFHCIFGRGIGCRLLLGTV